MLDLRVECLQSLDQTIDQFFVEYEKTGREDLFEDLCPYFGNPWPAGLALAGYLQEQLLQFREKRVLEIGCGLAIPSLFLAKNGVDVQASDLHPDVPVFLSRNLKKNAISSLVFLNIDWRTERIEGHYDYLIGSDFCYDQKTPELLSAFLKEFLVVNRVAIFSDPGRPYWESFLYNLKEKGFRVDEFLRDSIFFARVTLATLR